MKLKIDIQVYNTLYGIVEVGLERSWDDLGLTHEEILSGAACNTEFQKGELPPIYYLEKKHSNAIVDKILEELGIGFIE